MILVGKNSRVGVGMVMPAGSACRYARLGLLKGLQVVMVVQGTCGTCKVNVGQAAWCAGCGRCQHLMCGTHSWTSCPALGTADEVLRLPHGLRNTMNIHASLV